MYLAKSLVFLKLFIFFEVSECLGLATKDFEKVQKCCKVGEALSIHDGSCVKQRIPESWDVTFPLHSFLETMNEDEEMKPEDILAPILNNYECSVISRQNPHLLLNVEGKLEFLLDTQTLLLFSTHQSEFVKDFCVDRIVNFTLTQTNALGTNEETINYTFLGTAAKICIGRNDPCASNCLRLCCPLGTVFESSLGSCAGGQVRVDDVLTNNHQSILTASSSSPLEAISVIHDPLTCSASTIQTIRQWEIKDKIQLMANSSIKFGSMGELAISDYCILASETKLLHVQTCVDVNEQMKSWLLHMRYILSAFSMTSVFFLFITLMHVIKKNRFKLFGIMTACMVSTLLTFNVTYVSVLLQDSKIINSVICQIQGFALQFSFLSALFWLNCMSLLVWRSFNQMGGGANADLNHTRPWLTRFFWKSSAWALGAPTLILIVTIAIHNISPGMESNYLIRPNIGNGQCFLHHESVFFYLHIVAGPSLLLNVIAFSLTSWNLCCGIWSRDSLEQKSTQRVNNFWILVKMFIAMGVTWTAEVVSWTLGHFFGTETWVLPASAIFDASNSLNGVWIFFAFTLDLEKVKKCFRWNRNQGETTFQARYIVKNNVDSVLSDGEENKNDSTISTVQSVDVTCTTTISSDEHKSPLRKSMGKLTSPLRKTYSYELKPNK